MKIETQYPFLDYKGYLVVNPEGRKNICLVHKTQKQRTTISYARYLVCVNEKRILSKNEHVDHIDGDKTNDTINNLQILSQKDNMRKSFQERKLTLKMVDMICPNCNNLFSKPLSQSFLNKNGKFNACSKHCLSSFLKKGLSIQELYDVGKKQVVRHYRK